MIDNLTAPKVLASMTGIVEAGVNEEGLRHIVILTIILTGLSILGVGYVCFKHCRNIPVRCLSCM